MSLTLSVQTLVTWIWQNNFSKHVTMSIPTFNKKRENFSVQCNEKVSLWEKKSVFVNFMEIKN